MNTWLIILSFAVILTTTSGNTEQNVLKEEDKMKTFPKKMLARRREEHFSILKMIAQNPKYEHRFQLLLIGLTKSLELINEHRNQLQDENAEKVTKAKMIVVENGCLFMDFIVNFTDDIYVVLRKISKTDPDKNWKEILRISLEVLDTNQDLLDEVTSKEFNFVKDNLDRILNEERIEEYPFENSVRNILEITQKSNKEEEEKFKEPTKKKKKIKKGPTLQGRNEL